MLKAHEVVALTSDFSVHGLQKGDVWAVVHCYQNGDVYEVEFIDEHGSTKCTASIPESQLVKLNLRS